MEKSTWFVIACVGLGIGAACGGSGGGGDGGKPPSANDAAFAGTWVGSEEYVQGTFANPLALVNLGPTTLKIDASGNIAGQTFDVSSLMTYMFTGTLEATSMTAATGNLNGLPGPFNTATEPDLMIGGNVKLTGSLMEFFLGSSLGECTISLSQGTKNLYVGTFTGTVKASGGGTGTVTSFAVDANGNVTGSITVGGMSSTLSGTITVDDVATITETPTTGSPVSLTGAAALTGTNGDMTVYLTQTGAMTSTMTLTLTPAS